MQRMTSQTATDSTRLNAIISRTLSMVVTTLVCHRDEGSTGFQNPETEQVIGLISNTIKSSYFSELDDGGVEGGMGGGVKCSCQLCKPRVKYNMLI